MDKSEVNGQRLKKALRFPDRGEWSIVVLLQGVVQQGLEKWWGRGRGHGMVGYGRHGEGPVKEGKKMRTSCTVNCQNVE